jgi:hypothetical protein
MKRIGFFLWGSACFSEGWGEDGFKFFTIDGFNLKKFLSDSFKFIPVFGENFSGFFIGFVHQEFYFLINVYGNGFRIITLFRDFTTKEYQFFFFAIHHRSHGITHAGLPFLWQSL